MRVWPITTSRNQSLRIVKFRWNQSLIRENIIQCLRRITNFVWFIFVGRFSFAALTILFGFWGAKCTTSNALNFLKDCNAVNLYMVRKENRIDRQKVRLPIKFHSPFIIPMSTMSKARVKFSWNPPYIHDWNVREHVWSSNGNVDMSIGQGVENLPGGHHVQLPSE